MSEPRGIRNNNPGNIRLGESWLGMTATQIDPAFVQFVSPEYGIRAIAKIMASYQLIGINTIRRAILRWAPPTENNTDSYVAAVCAECSVGPDDPVELDTILPLLIKAIIWHENGVQPYSDDLIQRGIALA